MRKRHEQLRATLGTPPREVGQEPATNRTCVIVLGMHRSGTSVVAGTLGLLGVRLPADLLGVAESNARGHFESTAILALNEQLLQALDTAWYDSRHISSASFDSASAQQFRTKLTKALQRSFGDASLFVLKDPRFCRFFPLARSAIEDFGSSLGVVLCFRNPLEVANSLQKRDAIPLSHSFALWLRHMLDAELHSRGLPRVFINFYDFLQDWRTAIARIEHRLGVAFPVRWTGAASEVDEFVDAGLRHHVASIQELEGRFGDRGWITSCYEAFAQLARNPDDKEAMRRLDLIRNAFEESARLFGDGFNDYYTELLGVWRAHAAQAEQLADVNRQLEQLADVNRQLEDAHGQLEHAHRKFEALNGKLERAWQTNAMLKTRVAKAKQQLRAIRRSRSWRVTAPFRGTATLLRRLKKRHQ